MRNDLRNACSGGNKDAKKTTTGVMDGSPCTFSFVQPDGQKFQGVCLNPGGIQTEFQSRLKSSFSCDCLRSLAWGSLSICWALREHILVTSWDVPRWDRSFTLELPQCLTPPLIGAYHRLSIPPLLHLVLICLCNDCKAENQWPVKVVDQSWLIIYLLFSRVEGSLVRKQKTKVKSVPSNMFSQRPHLRLSGWQSLSQFSSSLVLYLATEVSN